MKIIAAVFLCLLLATPASWAGFDEGVAAYRQGDYAAALREFRTPAEQGDADAQFNLGLMYRKGQGVAQDYALAMKWYRKAAEQGYASAQINLGFMYDKGQGVPQNYIEAHKWFNLAATKGNKAARKNRDNIEKRMTRGQLAEAQRLARSWKPRKNAAVPVPRAPDTTGISQRIARTQRQLASLGYDPGAADGVLGPKTRAAIRAFEAREGLTVTGTISERLEAALRSASPTVANKASRPLKKTSTGSGFFVSPAGHVLTNEHVVAKCREVRVAGAKSARGIVVDKKIDLALLKLSPGGRSAVRFRDGRGVRTGDDIIVAGYPLHGLVSSELNVTKGIVSSLTGPRDDRRIMQITAPVQPGNSGGPVLDASGHVVGVVVARLDALKLARKSGIRPQNVNFAISEGSARAFLDSHDVLYETARSAKSVPTADIAARAKGYTVLIECWK